jgi:hypothetical protein
MATELVVHPVTPDRWDDLVMLFGERGASSGCWCMFFRRSGGEFERQAGAAAREGLRELVRDGAVPGLLDVAIQHAAAARAVALEGYPRDTTARPHPNAELYMGTVSMFRAAGFQEVERRSPTRPIMRLELQPGDGSDPGPPAAA